PLRVPAQAQPAGRAAGAAGAAQHPRRLADARRRAPRRAHRRARRTERPLRHTEARLGRACSRPPPLRTPSQSHMEYIRSATRHIPLNGDVTLDYDGRSGNLLVEGADTDKVTVQIVAHVFEESADAADTTLQRIVDGVRQNERTVFIRPPEPTPQGPWFFRFNRGLRVDYAVTVPHSTRCR